MGEPRSELRRLREARGLTIKELAGELRISPDSLGRIEAGRQDPQGENFRNLADSLRISYQKLRDILNGIYLPGKVDENGHQLIPKKFSLFVALEAQARKLQVFADRRVDGLLQTADYARVLIENERGMGPAAEQRIDLRMNRQKALTRKDQPLQYVTVVYEAALCLEVGDNRVMREQFEKLEYLAGLPNVDLRVLPFSAGPWHPDFGGFTLLTLPYDDEPSIAYEELYDGPSHKESEHHVQLLMRTFQTLMSMSLDRDETLAVIDRMKRRYPA